MQHWQGPLPKHWTAWARAKREHSNERRRQVTFHSFQEICESHHIRPWVCRLFGVFHGASLFPLTGEKKNQEKAEILRKIEPYSTFLNIHQLERQGADILSNVNELEEVNQSLRERYKSKDDVITMLSDQLLTITERLKSWKRRQQWEYK